MHGLTPRKYTQLLLIPSYLPARHKMHPSVVEGVHRQSGTSIKHVLRLKVIAKIKPYFKVSLQKNRLWTQMPSFSGTNRFASDYNQSSSFKKKNSYKTLRKELTW